MKLSFKESFLSIKEFREIDLPPFVLLTGHNGTGKTHLLKAIQQGAIKVDVTKTPKEDTRYFDWNTMVPHDSGMFDGHTVTKTRAELFRQFEAHQKRAQETITTVARQFGIQGNYLTNPSDLFDLSDAELSSVIAGSKNVAEVRNALIQQAAKASRGIRQHLANDDLREQLDDIERHKQKLSVFLKRDDFFSTTIPSWGKADAFQQSFGRLFVGYRDLWLNNQVKLLARQNGREVDSALEQKEFVDLYNIPPWVFVNEAIIAAGLDFEIDSPDEFSHSPYQPKLRKRSNDAEVSFGNLSSGEKILMSLALCLYYVRDGRQTAHYPKLLLLDEVDAPLHPSMSRSLIAVLADTIVTRRGINVIAATHSPSTIAIAPEESIYCMVSNPPGLQNISKAEALNILTDGVPTLAISYDGRRQVFVESGVDAQIYDAAYQILRKKLDSQRSLEFVATGMKSPSGSEINSGGKLVKTLVETLAKAGNKSVFGLVDWDGCAVAGDRVSVLAAGTRNGLENVILDPLLLASLIAGYSRKLLPEIGLSEDMPYPSMLVPDLARLQTAVDGVVNKVLGNNAGSLMECDYVGKFKLRIPESFLKMDDHALESAIYAAFPAMEAIASSHRRGALMQFVVENVIRAQPDYAPLELFSAFEKLLAQPSH
jgi:ABC-type transport system involved in cytochrome c biogenesis ATPase subunit